MREVRAIDRSIGAILNLCREIKGKSMRDVEKDIGLSSAFQSQFEQGKTSLGFENAVKLCDYYGIKLDRLAAPYRELSAAPRDGRD